MMMMMMMMILLLLLMMIMKYVYDVVCRTRFPVDSTERFILSSTSKQHFTSINGRLCRQQQQNLLFRLLPGRLTINPFTRLKFYTCHYYWLEKICCES